MNLFNKHIKKSHLQHTIMLCVFSLLVLHAFTQNSNIQSLVNSVIVNDNIKCKIYKDSLTNTKSIIINNEKSINRLYIQIDSTSIKKFNLIKYRFNIGDSEEQFSSWSPYPVKEYFDIDNNYETLTIEALSSSNQLIKDIIRINFQYGYLHSYSKYIIYTLLIVIFLIMLYFWIDYKIAHDKYILEKEISNRTEELREQKEKYEEVLTNYLPKEEFEKLKAKTSEKTHRFKMVTVLFSNIHGFTKVAEQTNADQLIDDIDKFIFHFDSVVEKLHIEKIKTIGDSYMCAGGIPQKNRTNPIEVVLAAFEMQQYMQTLKNQYKLKNEKIWDLRMGIHTGPVFSNLGNKKRLEIWGDTVNIATRMEASGEIGKVNITGMTYELVKDYFLCRYRGKMPVKYKGEIDMYIIEGFRPALSVDGIGIKPNKAFKIRLGHIRFDDLEEYVMNMLEEKLPKNLHYHNLKHTIDVTVGVEIIGRSEGINDEEMLLLKTAALFHDTGFINTYKDHEEEGVKIAKSILPDYDYSPEQIDKICELIMATKLPPKPKNLLEQIICDADLDYLGRVDFIPVSGNLFRELTEHNIIENDINKWNKIQIDFIEKHQYFTETAKKQRDVNKNIQLEAIRKIVIEEENK